jgi:hypothetical protein
MLSSPHLAEGVLVWCAMDIVELVAGALVALPFEFLAHMGWDRYKREKKAGELKKRYAFLARRYTNLREGTVPTGGSIELAQSIDGTFNITGFNADRSIEWEGKLRMSPDELDVGIATYRYLSKPDHGTQRVVYLPYNDTLHVLGTNQSTSQHREFVHVWDPEVHLGRILT